MSRLMESGFLTLRGQGKMITGHAKLCHQHSGYATRRPSLKPEGARLITATGAPVSDPARSKVPRQHAGSETGAPVVVSRCARWSFTVHSQLDQPALFPA